jgi:hypothetical protein
VVKSEILDVLVDSTPIGGDRYCPECGQSLFLGASMPAHVRREHSFGWGLVAVAIGLYLLLAYGPRVWYANVAEQSVVATIVGMITILVGVGSFVRRRLRSNQGGWIAATGLDYWTKIENLFLALLCLALGGYSLLLASELAAGSPLTWSVATQVSDRFFGIFSDTARFVALESSVPHCPCSP